MTDLDVSQMTPEQRLRQIEIILSTVAKNINRHDEIFTRTEQQIANLSDLVWSTARVVAQQQTNIEALQTEVRVSQAECQRIWEYLTTQNRNGNGNNPQ